jgi:myo-inositol-1(or 4)-monophosphatase
MELERTTREITRIVEDIRRTVFASAPGGRVDSEMKGGYEVVTEYDKRSSDMLIKELAKAFPGIPAMSEESPASDFDLIPHECFLIDPLDGTMNFVRGLPYSSISVSFVENGKPVIGVTANISSDETFWAWQSGGFWKNGRRVKRIKYPGMILGTGFAYETEVHPQHLANINRIFSRFTDMRRLASFCLDQCYLSEGKLDAVFEMVKPWDFFAGIVMAEESGLVTHIAEPLKSLSQQVYFISGEREIVDYIKQRTDFIIKRT